MKQCPQCGRAANDNERFCGVCGTSLPETMDESANNPGAANNTANENITNEAQALQNPLQNAQPVQPTQAAYTTSAKTVYTRKNFLKLEENKIFYRLCLVSAIFCYFYGATILYSLCYMSINFYTYTTIGWSAVVACLVANIILFTLGFGIHLKQSRVCAIILTALSLILVIDSFIEIKTFRGLDLIFNGIFAVIITFTIHNRWKEYQQQQAGQQPLQNAQSVQPTQAIYTTSAKTVSTKKEFLKLKENKIFYRLCLLSAIFCYLYGAIIFYNLCYTNYLYSKSTNFSKTFAWSAFVMPIIENIILFTLGFGIHLKQSRVCAIILTALSLVLVIASFINTKQFAYWEPVFYGVFAVITTFTIHIIGGININSSKHISSRQDSSHRFNNKSILCNINLYKF